MKPDKSTSQYVRTIHKSLEFDAHYDSLPAKVQDKYDYVMNVIATVYNVPVKFVKHIETTDLYEMRVSVGTNEYRTVLFAMDHDNIIEAKNILLLNGFLKKDKKDYKRQLEIAETILNQLES